MRSLPIDFSTYLNIGIFLTAIACTWMTLRFRQLFPRDIRWIFGLLLGTTAFFIEYVIANGWVAAELIVLIFNSVVCAYLTRELRKQGKPVRGLKDNTYGREIIFVVVITMTLLSITMGFNFRALPSQNNGKVFETRNVFAFSTHGVDNLAHINISEYNVLHHHVGYWDETVGSIPRKYPMSYPQLFHATHGTVFDMARVTNHAVGQPVSDLFLLYATYLVLLFCMISMTIALMWKFIRSFIIPIMTKIPQRLSLAVSAACLTTLICFHHTMMLWGGFASQIAVDLFLIAFFVALTTIKKEVLLIERIAPIVLLCIAIGNTWWLFLPTYFIAATLYICFSQRGNISRRASVLIKSAVLLAMFIFSLLSAFSESILKGANIGDISKLNGSYYSIPYKVVLPVLIITSLGLLYIHRTKIFPLSRKSLSALACSSDVTYWGLAGFVTLFIINQRKSLGHINYYGMKAMWSSTATMLLISLFLIATFLELMPRVAAVISQRYVATALTAGALVVLIITGAGIVDKQENTTRYGQDKGKLVALAAIQKKLKLPDELLVFSQKSPLEDFMFMRFNTTVRGLETLTSDSLGEALLTGRIDASNDQIIPYLTRNRISVIAVLHGCAALKPEMQFIHKNTKIYSLHSDGRSTVCKR